MGQSGFMVKKRNLPPLLRLELRKHSFSQRIVDHWNKLPDDVVSTATISTFKRRLDTWMDRYGH